MTNSIDPKSSTKKKSRYAFAGVFVATLVAAWFLLRLIIFFKFGPKHAPSVGTVIESFLIGLHQDITIALLMALPLLFWFWILRNRSFAKRWSRVLLIGGMFFFWAVQIFILFTEFYFFDEFQSRFTTVAVDYLIYPTEVFGNIRDSYPLYRIIAICVAASAAWVYFAFRYFRPMWHKPVAAGTRFLVFVGTLIVTVGLLFTISLQGTHFSQDRVMNEVADNGSLAFVAAAWTHNLDYSAFYDTIPRDKAYARVRKMLTSPQAEFVGDSHSIRRKIAGDPNRPKLNVVILLEESLGSEFWGCLGRTNTLTPNMDKIATEDGLLFTNIYACGNRTVRGFEGVFSSFPPLPGDSIVKRDRSENVESIARILKRDGYNTLFLYGGRGLFDGMRSYAERNGWDRFIEEKDFEHPTFKTIWGVCDGDLYKRSIEEFRKLNDTGKPFLGTLLTVSNHKPYDIPAGRVPELPTNRKHKPPGLWKRFRTAMGFPPKPKSSRNRAVRYTDWALGQFFDAAKKEAFWTNTVFVVVADHGARVYGSQEIPIFSYEIPLVILGPAVVKEPKQLGMLGNSLDVSPTILGLIGRPYETMFFGRDLFHDPPEGAHALLNHNRDIGMFADDRMAVLGLQKTVKYYAGDPKVTDLKPVEEPTPQYLELRKNATAIYQVADDLYMHRLYRIDGMPEPQSSGTNAVNASTESVK